MSVYFAQVGRYIKVGYSENPQRRVANLFASTTRYGAPKDIGSATPRTLLAVLPGRLNEERAAHAALDEFRVKGEWFIDEPEVRDYICRCVGAGGVATEIVRRPVGPFDRYTDPILRPTPDELAERARVADAISAAMEGALGRASP